MFSKSCEYAIRACIFIAAESLKRVKVGQKTIAQAIGSPEAFTGNRQSRSVYRKNFTKVNPQSDT